MTHVKKEVPNFKMLTVAYQIKTGEYSTRADNMYDEMEISVINLKI